MQIHNLKLNFDLPSHEGTFLISRKVYYGRAPCVAEDATIESKRAVALSCFSQSTGSIGPTTTTQLNAPNHETTAVMTNGQ